VSSVQWGIIKEIEENSTL